MKYLKKIFLIIAQTISIFLLIVLLLSAFSDRVSPLTSIYFSYLGLFFPFILLANLISIFIWLFIKKWKIVLLSLFVLVICGNSIYTYFPIHSKTKEIPEDCIKILTYNVMRFDHIKPHTSSKPNEILQYLKNSNADIICIQEYGASQNSKNKLTHADVKKVLKDYPHQHIHNLKFPYKGENLGLAIFSKFPITSVKGLPFKSEYNGSVVAELEIKGKKVTLINNHLESNKLSVEERNNYYNLTKDFDSQKFDVFTSMMAQRLGPAYKIRAGQAQMINQAINENKNPYLIVCGDFNDTPISYAHHKIKGDLVDAFVNSGCGLGTTFNRYRFLFRIDYILHSKNIKSYNCTVDKIRSSDHYPVWSYLQLQ